MAEQRKARPRPCLLIGKLPRGWYVACSECYRAWDQLPTWRQALQIGQGHLAGYRLRLALERSTAAAAAFTAGFTGAPAPRSASRWCPRPHGKK